MKLIALNEVGSYTDSNGDNARYGREIYLNRNMIVLVRHASEETQALTGAKSLIYITGMSESYICVAEPPHDIHRLCVI